MLESTTLGFVEFCVLRLLRKRQEGESPSVKSSESGDMN